MAEKGLCANCTHAIWCPTWTEWRCPVYDMRFSSYGFPQPTKCSSYEKRGKSFVEPKCECEDCLKNEKLWNEEDEE